MPAKISENEVRFFSGQSHPELATEITNYIGVPLHPTYFDRYSNDNLYIQLGASVRGRDVYLIQSLTRPVSDHLMELFMMCDIARSAGAKNIHAIIPYYSYARSDKKDAPRISITGRLVADLLQCAGASHVMTMTLHSPQVHGFFSIPTDPITSRHLFVKHFSSYHLDPNTTIVVAPDSGRANAAARFASLLGLYYVAAEKRRISDTEVIISPTINRQLEGYTQAIVYDDEIATGGSVIQLSKTLVSCGIDTIRLVCTHGVFSRNALPRLGSFPQIVEIITTNTVPIPVSERPPHLHILSVAPVFGEAIIRNHNQQSIGDLFTYSES